MVLLARSFQRCARPVSSRAFSTSFARSPRPSTVRSAVSSRSAGGPSLSLPPRSAFGTPSSIRLLTGKREKVKVLLVLYDGGEHAKQVCPGCSRASRPVPLRPPSREASPSTRIAYSIRAYTSLLCTRPGPPANGRARPQLELTATAVRGGRVLPRLSLLHINYPMYTTPMRSAVANVG